MKRKIIQFNRAEIQSGSHRVKHAEGLILQLPENHDGRNTWLLNFGTGQESVKLREKHSLVFDKRTRSAETRT